MQLNPESPAIDIEDRQRGNGACRKWQVSGELHEGIGESEPSEQSRFSRHVVGKEAKDPKEHHLRDDQPNDVLAGPHKVHVLVRLYPSVDVPFGVDACAEHDQQLFCN